MKTHNYKSALEFLQRYMSSMNEQVAPIYSALTSITSLYHCWGCRRARLNVRRWGMGDDNRNIRRAHCAGDNRRRIKH